MFARVFSIRFALISLWLVAVGAGFAMTMKYQNTGGAVGSQPQQWPKETRIVLDARRDTLVMFAHPRCPCTRASMEELNRVLAQAQDRVAAQVFFFRPGGSSEDWVKTDLWRSAAAIPGVSVHEDRDGVEAGRFGAETSGFVLLFDTHGHILFQGGITGSRGHAGDNAGESAVLAILAGQPAGQGVEKTPVYGCSLLNKVCEREEAAK
jgi:hypothetical protein